MQDFEDIINQNPFSHEKESYITYFNQKIENISSEKLNEKKSVSEKIHLTQEALFLHCADGYGKTKLNNNFVEKSLKTIATTRNFNTSKKILEILKETL